MTSRSSLLAVTALSTLLVGSVLAQAPTPQATSPQADQSRQPGAAPSTNTARDGTPGNPPSTATQRAADGATGNRTPADGTPGNPPGTAATRALDRAAGTNTSGAMPQNNDGTPNNPAGTAVGRTAEGGTSGTPRSATPPSPPASTAAPSTPTTGSVAQPSTLGSSPSASSAPAASAVVGSRPTSAADHQRASKIVGTSVYNDRNESIGSVDDLVLGANGTPTVVVSVGGFLGIGAKLVAVPFEELRWNGNESRWVIAGATRDSLTSLPTFEYGSGRG